MGIFSIFKLWEGVAIFASMWRSALSCSQVNLFLSVGPVAQPVASPGRD